MNHRRKLIIALTVLVVGALVYHRFGRTWRVEWDVASGRQRTVTIFLGIPNHGEPEPTRLSEWKGQPSGEPRWVTVGSPSRSMSPTTRPSTR